MSLGATQPFYHLHKEIDTRKGTSSMQPDPYTFWDNYKCDSVPLQVTTACHIVKRLNSPKIRVTQLSLHWESWATRQWFESLVEYSTFRPRRHGGLFAGMRDLTVG